MFVWWQRIQDMEERRIERICEAMRSSAEAERKVLPVVSRCLDAMMASAEGIQPRMVSLLWAHFALKLNFLGIDLNFSKPLCARV